MATLPASAPLDRVVHALEERDLRPRGPKGKMAARCPAHDDRVASLSLAAGSDGRVLLHCHAGCGLAEIVGALGLTEKDLFEERENGRPPSSPPAAPKAVRGPQDAAEVKFRPPSDADLDRWRVALTDKTLERLKELRGWSPEAVRTLGLGLDGERLVFCVRDAGGAVVGISRYLPNPETRDGSKMQADPGSRRELFPAPEILDDGDVWIVEGEPDAVAATTLGLSTVSIPGANGWRAEWAERFAGRRVVVVGDCDPQGRELAKKAASDLAGHAADVRVVDLDPSRDDGFDLGDLLREAGRDGRAELLRLLERMAREAKPVGYAPRNGAQVPNGATPPASAPVEPPETSDVLGRVATLIKKYIVLASEHELLAVALWVAHTWAFDGAHATPYLLVVSPERRSGKTRLLEVLELLVRAPWRVASASEAAMFRKINDHKPTLLLDEIDAIFGSASERTEPLRAVLNAGNRPGSAVARCVGEGAKQTVVDFSVYCPKVLAGIDTGRVPDTIVDRSIRLAMKRKIGTEPTEPLRHRHADREARPVREGLEAWGAAHAAGLLKAEPDDMPGALDDRAVEAWEPLLAVADLAGGEAAARARAAAVALIGDHADEPGHGARLLAALRDIFAGHDALATTTILEHVNDDDELPFGGWRHGEGLDARGLARLLKPYGVKRRTVRLGDATAKGYRRDQFEEPWARYLPTPHKASQGTRRSQPAPRLEPDVTLVTDVTGNPENGAGEAGDHVKDTTPEQVEDATPEQEAEFERVRRVRRVPVTHRPEGT